MDSPSNNSRLARAWCALCFIFIAAIGGVNLAHALRRVPPAPRHPPVVADDAAMRSEQRLARLRNALERRGIRGTIGYIADVAPDTLAADDAAMKEYFLSQFALVPAVLDVDAVKFAWAIANLHTTKPSERLPAGFRVIEDFGDGVLLLRKEAP